MSQARMVPVKNDMKKLGDIADLIESSIEGCTIKLGPCIIITAASGQSYNVSLPAWSSDDSGSVTTTEGALLGRWRSPGKLLAILRQKCAF